MSPPQRTRPLAIAAVLVLAIAAPVRGGQDGPVQFASAIDVMRIHVGVHDADGGFVSGLGIDDFEVWINGERRTLVDALEVSDATRVEEILLPVKEAGVPAELTAAPVPPPRLPPAARRHFLIFFDLTLSNIRSVRYAREAALEFVRDVALPSDVLGLATYSPRQGLGVPVAFTTNHRRVEEVLEAFTPAAAIDGADPGGSGLDASARAAVATDTIRERFEPIGGNFNLTAMRAFEAAQAATQITNSAEDMVQGLQLLFDAMAPEQGRKHVLFFSNGLPNEVFAQTRFRDQANDAVGSAILTDTVLHSFAPDSVTVTNYDDASRRVVGEGVRRAGPQVNNAPTGASIIVDESRDFDPLADRASSFGERDVLHFLPAETGGTATFYRGDLAEGLAAVEASTRSFYVLAFRLTDDDQTAIDIDVRSVRPEVEIGWAPERLQLVRTGGARTTLQSRLELASALESAADRADIRLELRAMPISMRDNYGRTAIVAQIEPSELARLRGQRGDGKLEFEILGQVIDPTGEIVDYFRTQALSNVESGGDGIPFRYFNTVVVPPGRYHIRFVIQELGTGRLVSRRLRIDVPETPAFKLRMSGPVMVRGGDGIIDGTRFGEQPPHRATRPVTYPFQIGELDLTPDLRTVVNPGERVELFALVYDLRPPSPDDDPQAGLDVALRNAAGDFVFVERFGGVVWERNPEDGSMRLGVQLWIPDDLPSGPWELVVQATDLSTGMSTDAGMDLTVLSAGL